MKKYNLVKIMKRAWEIRKSTGSTMSTSLKQAWREAKMSTTEIKMAGSEKQVKWALDILAKAGENLKKVAAKSENDIKQDAESFYEGETLETQIKKIEARTERACKLFAEIINQLAEENGAAYVIERRYAIQKVERVFEAVRRKADLRKSEAFAKKTALEAVKEILK